MLSRSELNAWFETQFEYIHIPEYCPNGLQVEGHPEIGKVAAAVSAPEQVIDEAVRWGADALIVHHGLFWKGTWNHPVGPQYRKLKKLMDAGINLFAFHLPLDGHMKFGNAAQLASKLDIDQRRPFGDVNGQNIGVSGKTDQQLDDLVIKIKDHITANPIILKQTETVKNVTIVTGSGESEFENAIHSGADTFITGEGTEWVTHLSNEYRVNYLALGHHASERFGVQALLQEIAGTFTIESTFIESNNPF